MEFDNNLQEYNPKLDLDNYLILDQKFKNVKPRISIIEKGNNELGFSDDANSVEISIYDDNDAADIEVVFVKEDEEGQGIGTFLLKEAVKRATEKYKVKFFSSKIMNPRMLSVLQKVFRYNIFYLNEDNEIEYEQAIYEMKKNGKSIDSISFGLKNIQ